VPGNYLRSSSGEHFLKEVWFERITDKHSPGKGNTSCFRETATALPTVDQLSNEVDQQ